MTREILFLFFFSFSSILPLSARAAETQPGDACSTAGLLRETGGPEQIPGRVLVCNGAVWKALQEYTTDGKSLFQVNSDSGTCGTDKQGRLRYTSASDIWEYCTGSTWAPFEHAGAVSDCSIFGQVPGYVCADGTVFAGFATDIYEPLFVTRCDAGQAWSGSCTGTRAFIPWNSGSSTGTVATGAGLKDGKANTVLLSAGGTYEDSKSNLAGVQPHQAAQYCSDLSSNGHTDWYLPSQTELMTILVHQAAIGNFLNNEYWTSSEKDASNTYILDFNLQEIGSSSKFLDKYFRCARRK